MGRSTPFGVEWLPLVGVLVTVSAAISARADNFTVCPAGCDSSTIQGAINMAAAGDEIVLSTTLPHTEADILVFESVVIRGVQGLNGSVRAAPSQGTAAARVFTIPAGVSVEIADLTIVNGVAATGGGILNQGELTLLRVVLSGHEASTGGGIYNEGVLNLIDSTVQASRAGSRGGGIYNAPGAELEASDCSFLQNIATDILGTEGGHLFNAGMASLVACSLTNGNVELAPSSRGGGIFNQGSLVLREVTFANCQSTGSGGGIYQSSGETELNGGLFFSNDAVFGGAIYIAGGAFVGSDVDIVFNVASYRAGGVLIASPTLSFVLDRATLRNNEAGAGGGGGLFVDSSTAKLANVTVSNNSTSVHGGGAYVANGRSLSVSSATVIENMSDSDGDDLGDGGGFYLDPNCGGGICLLPIVTLANSIVTENEDMSPTGRQAHDCEGRLSSGGYNLFGDVSGGGLGSECTVIGDMTGVVIGQNSLLADIADNGGIPPAEGEGPPWTHASLPFSPVIDAGDPSGCRDSNGNLLLRDQRYALRVGRCDLGAFEFGGVPNSLFSDGFESGDTARWSSAVQ